MALDQVAERDAVIGLVREHDGARRKIIKQDIGCTTIGDLTTREQEAERLAFAVCERVEFAVEPAPADPDRLDERPLSAARRAVRLHVSAIDKNLGGWSALPG